MCFSLVRCGYSFFQNVEIITISAWANDIPLAHSSDLHTSVHLIAANLATLMLNLSAFHALLHTFFVALFYAHKKTVATTALGDQCVALLPQAHLVLLI